MPNSLNIDTRPIIRPRNPVARSPLLRKGGAHDTSKTALRQQTRQRTQVQLEDWREDLAFERSLKSGG